MRPDVHEVTGNCFGVVCLESLLPKAWATYQNTIANFKNIGSGLGIDGEGYGSGIVMTALEEDF